MAPGMISRMTVIASSCCLTPSQAGRPAASARTAVTANRHEPLIQRLRHRVIPDLREALRVMRASLSGQDAALILGLLTAMHRDPELAG